MSITLAIMLAMPQSHLDRGETPEQRAALIQPWADGIDEATESTAMRAALVALMWHETGGFARYVLEYRCSDGPRGKAECDSGKARGGFQVHPWCKATTIAGEAECAASTLGFMLKRCGSWATAYGGYGTGGKCAAFTERETTRQRVAARFR